MKCKKCGLEKHGMERNIRDLESQMNTILKQLRIVVLALQKEGIM